jgi:hypothetical protein
MELTYLLIGILLFWIWTIESTIKLWKDTQKSLLYTNIKNIRIEKYNQLKYVYIYNYFTYSDEL